jgi:hypothetical protein
MTCFQNAFIQKEVSSMQEKGPFAPSKLRWNQAAHWLALAGVVGPILFVVVFTLPAFPELSELL